MEGVFGLRVKFVSASSLRAHLVLTREKRPVTMNSGGKNLLPTRVPVV
jgi:hypothetical protein